MKPQFQIFNEQINSIITDQMCRNQIVAAAVAFAIASKAPVPSTAVGSAMSYYTSQVIPATSRALSQINEAVIFDKETVKALICAFWKLRYSAMHPAIRGFSEKHTFIEVITGGAEFFSPVETEMLNKHNKQICMLSHAAVSLLNNLE